MKKRIIISLAIASIASALTASDTLETPVQTEFAYKLVSVFGGTDHVLSKAELTRVLDFLHTNLPEQTGYTNLANRMSRQNTSMNAARGDMTEERYSIREVDPEFYVTEFLKKYDVNKDKYITRTELAKALTEVIGTPKAGAGFNQGSIAQR